MDAAKTPKPAATRRRNMRGEGERLRGDLIVAATNVLGRLGPEDAFSLRAVAKEANVAAPSVYLHFEDRNVLVLAVLDHLFAEQVAAHKAVEEAVIVSGGTAWDCLLALSLAYVRFGLERTGHYKVLYEGRVTARHDDPKVAVLGRPLLAQKARLIREVLLAGQTGRRIEDPERLALLLWANLHGIVSLRANTPALPWPSADALAEQALRALVRLPTAVAAPTRPRQTRVAARAQAAR